MHIVDALMQKAETYVNIQTDKSVRAAKIINVISYTIGLFLFSLLKPHSLLS